MRKDALAVERNRGAVGVERIFGLGVAESATLEVQIDSGLDIELVAGDPRAEMGWISVGFFFLLARFLGMGPAQEAVGAG